MKNFAAERAWSIPMPIWRNCGRENLDHFSALAHEKGPAQSASPYGSVRNSDQMLIAARFFSQISKIFRVSNSFS